MGIVVLRDIGVMNGYSYILGHLPCSRHSQYLPSTSRPQFFGGRPLVISPPDLNCNSLLVRSFPKLPVRSFPELLVCAFPSSLFAPSLSSLFALSVSSSFAPSLSCSFLPSTSSSFESPCRDISPQLYLFCDYLITLAVQASKQGAPIT